MTYEEYVKEVRKEFPMGTRPKEEIDAYFKEDETVKFLKDSYKFNKEKDLPGTSPSAVAYCLHLMY